MSRHRAPGRGGRLDATRATRAAHEDGAAEEPAEQPIDVGTADAVSETAAAEPDGADRTSRRWWLRGRVLVPVGVLVTAGAVTAAVLVVRGHEPASPSGATPDLAAAAEGFVAGASADITSVTSYDYRSLDVALQTGSSVATGDYRRAYRAALTGGLAATARAQQIVQTFEQDAAGIGTIDRSLTSAKVLIFGQQSVSRRGGSPQRTAVTLTATMVKRGSRYLIGELEVGANAGIPAGNSSLAAAAEAARRQTVAELTLRRASAAADVDAALADTVEPLRSSLSATLAATRTAVTRGGYDLSGRVTAIAIESAAAGAPVVVLVAATGVRTTNGVSTVVTDARLRVSVVAVDGAWRVTDSQPVAS